MQSPVLVIIITILFSAFFSGMEIAFISANKLRLELDKQQGSFHSRILRRFTKNPGQYIATMLVGNNIALVIYGLAFAQIMEPVFSRSIESDGAVLLLQTICSTLIILVTAEFLPKTLFRINPNVVLRLFSLPLIFFYYIFYPISQFSMGVSKFLLNHIFRASIVPREEKIVFSRIDLDQFVKEQNPSIDLENSDFQNEVKLFRNALDFSKIKLREIMVPRPEMVAMDVHSSIEELRHKFIETGYSRIIFFEEDIDHIIGYVHHSALFNTPEGIRQNLKDVLIVPETMQASKLLSKFIQQHRSIAIIVDEFGGTSGLVTSEDILEEIFGEIEDEHDTTDIVERKLNDEEYLFSARMELDDLNEKYQFNFPLDEHYETLAGYILYHHESIPKINSVIRIENFQFKILKASNTRIELVKLKLLDHK